MLSKSEAEVGIKKKLIECNHTLAGFREAKQLSPDANGQKRYRVVLLTEGKGNPRDKHYYSQACIDDPITAAAFEGKPCFLNHPSLIEDQSQPERRVQDKGGWFDNVRADGPALVADLTINSRPGGQLLECIIQDCMEYSKTHPGEDYDGLSINANGESTPVEMDGETWNQVDRITEAESVDAVTKAGRGGRFVAKLEALRKAKKEVDVHAPEKIEQIGEILKSMRDKIMAGEEFPLQKELRRQVDNALTLAGCDQPEEEPMMTEAQYQTMKKAVEAFEKAKTIKKAKESAKDLKDAAMGSAHKTLNDLAQAHPEHAELLKAHAAMYAPKDDGEGKDGEGEGESEGEDQVTDPEDTTESEKMEKMKKEKQKKEGEMEKDKKEKEKKEGEGEKEKMEAMRREIFDLKRDQKLAESGLPESMWKVVKAMTNGKTLEDVDQVIEAQNEAYEHMIRESGVHGGPSGLRESNSSDKPVLSGMAEFKF